MNVDRRTYLRSLAVAGVGVSTAGCSGVLGRGANRDENPNVVLGQPELGDLTLEQYRGHQYPVWNERIPDVTLTAPVDGEEVALRDVSKPSLVTYFYSHCRTACPRIVSGLVNVQGHAVENDYADAVAFFPITFDPARDDADRLRDYRERMNVRNAGRWQFLTPGSEERAQSVVGDQFGVVFQQTQMEGVDGYGFTHRGVIHLVNADGYVERAYALGNGTVVPVDRIIDDLRQVRETR